MITERPLRLAYRDAVTGTLDRILADQGAVLDAARDAIADALATDRIIHVTGTGHSHLIALEVFYRAGGLASAQAVLDEDLMLHRGAVRSTERERESGRAAKVLTDHGVGKGDVVVVVSNSGRNAYPVEAALAAKALGATTIALTSLVHSRAVVSRHASGKRLFEVADIVLDNGGVYGDAALAIPGTQLRMGPTSTVIGCWIVNVILAEAVACAAARGVMADVYQSANNLETAAPSVDLPSRWRDRIKGL